MVPLCDPRFASTGIVLVTGAGSSWRDWTPDDWAWEAWWVLPARHLYIKQETRRAQWPRVASECSHWIRGRMTHHHPLRFVTRGGVSLFLKVLKSDQCAESHWEWTLFWQIAEHHSIWAFENIFTTDYTFGLLRCSIRVRHNMKLHLYYKVTFTFFFLPILLQIQ